MTLAFVSALPPLHTKTYDPFSSEARAKVQLTAGDVIALVLEQNNSRDVAALTAVVLENLPSDYGGIRRALQELVVGEIRRQVEGRATILPRVAPTADEDDSPLMVEPAAAEFVEWEAPRRERSKARISHKWSAAAELANDPLRALVFVAGAWLPWGSLSADHLRNLARADEQKATKLLERVVRLDRLAADMDAAGAPVLASLPDAAARIEGL